jgi:hypothetical protein
MKRTVSALNLPRRVTDVLVYAKVVLARMTEEPLFDPPPALLSTLEADVAAFEAAVVSVASRRRGAAAVRKQCQSKVLHDLQQLQAYVQSLAQRLSPNEAAAVIERAGMHVKDARGPSKPPLRVHPGPLASTAHAYARAARTRASYEFQYAFEGGTWVSMAPTVRSDAPLEGLVPGLLYSVRVRMATKAGLSDFSEPVMFRAG